MAISVIEFLRQRRSVLVRNMIAPGPNRETLRMLLQVAARVPDHGKLEPWRFVVLEGADRRALGELAAVLHDDDPPAQETARQQFERAPCVVAVLAKAVPHPKIPQFEQMLSAGAACMMLLAGAQAMGFAAQWLTGPAAYEPTILHRLGGGGNDAIAGFIYLGTAAEPSVERARPDLQDIVLFGLPKSVRRKQNY